MNNKEADKLLDHYFPDLSKKEKDRILRFAAIYHKELREENQKLKSKIERMDRLIGHLTSVGYDEQPKDVYRFLQERKCKVCKSLATEIIAYESNL